MRAVRVVLCGLFSLALLITGFNPPASAATVQVPASPVRPVAQSAPKALPAAAAPESVSAPKASTVSAGQAVPQMPGRGAALAYLAHGLKGSAPARLPLFDPAWTISLAMTVGTSITLTATTNISTTNTNDWIIIYDTGSTSSTQYLKYCNGGTTCTVTTVPGEAGANYVAVVMPGSIPSQYPTSGTLATSNAVVPPPWTVTLETNIGSTVPLTATTNYDTTTGNNWIIIYDTASTSSTQYIKYCHGGTTCTVTTVPAETGARYVAVVMRASIPSQYPTSGTLATSNAIIPPPWTVTLASSGSTLTATTNYDTSNSNVWIEIFDLSRQGASSSYVGMCNGGTSCTKTTPYSGHSFIATAGSTNSVFPPSLVLATSNQTGTSGPTAAFETAGGSNPAEPYECFKCKSDPVNTSNGEFFENTTDVSIPGRGPGLVLDRTYSSQRSPFDGPFGFGWSFNYNMTLAVNSSGTVDVHQENGSMVTFTPDTNGVYHAPARVLAALAHNADGTWTYTRKAKDIGVVGECQGPAGAVGSGGELPGSVAGQGRCVAVQISELAHLPGRSEGEDVSARIGHCGEQVRGVVPVPCRRASGNGYRGQLSVAVVLVGEDPACGVGGGGDPAAARSCCANSC